MVVIYPATKLKLNIRIPAAAAGDPATSYAGTDIRLLLMNKGKIISS